MECRRVRDIRAATRYDSLAFCAGTKTRHRRAFFTRCRSYEAVAETAPRTGGVVLIALRRPDGHPEEGAAAHADPRSHRRRARARPSRCVPPGLCFRRECGRAILGLDRSGSLRTHPRL